MKKVGGVDRVDWGRNCGVNWGFEVPAAKNMAPVVVDGGAKRLKVQQKKQTS